MHTGKHECKKQTVFVFIRVYSWLILMHRHLTGRCAFRLLYKKRRAASQLRPTTATMPDVEDLHYPPDFVDLIVENVGGVHQRALRRLETIVPTRGKYWSTLM
jgi:hypothetical protein